MLRSGPIQFPSRPRRGRRWPGVTVAQVRGEVALAMQNSASLFLERLVVYFERRVGLMTWDFATFKSNNEAKDKISVGLSTNVSRLSYAPPGPLVAPAQFPRLPSPGAHQHLPANSSKAQAWTALPSPQHALQLTPSVTPVQRGIVTLPFLLFPALGSPALSTPTHTHSPRCG